MFLMVLFASSLTGFIFHGELGSAAYELGFVLGYIVAMMIINRSTKIFTKECLASGLIYALVIAAIVCVFRFDLIGYQKRVPEASRVESAIRSGAVTADEFRGAFKKTTTPFVSIRVDSASGTATGV